MYWIFLAYVPNAIGSYTHDLYEAEAAQVEDRMEDVQQLMFQLGEKTSDPIADNRASSGKVRTVIDSISSTRDHGYRCCDTR